MTEELCTGISQLQLLFSLLCMLKYYTDLNNGSVMWYMVPLDSYDRNTKYKYLGRPKKIAMNPHPGLEQAEVVKQMEVPQSLIKENVYLGDFGLAMTAGTSVSSKVQSPNVYCAPERFHNIGPSFASDMWSYMCLFAELYFGLVPFHGLFDGAGSTIVISSMVNALGPLPEHWKGNYEGVGAEVDSWYDQGRKPVPRMTLAAKIKRARPEASQTEIKNVLSFMSKGFCYLPESRMSAAELLEDASFKAVMQIGRPCDSSL